MADPVPPERSGERLESWKEIAAYLKRDVRTARRWEKLEGLPVHRHVHHKLATVYAFKTELDGWRARREAAVVPAETPPAASVWRPVSVILGTLASVAVALIVVRGAWPPAPRAATVASRRIPGRLLAYATGEGQQPTNVAHARAVSALVMRPDGTELLFTEREDRKLRILDTVANRISQTVALPGLANHLALSPDGRWAYLGTEEGDVLRLDVERRTLETLARGLTPVRDLALTDDGGLLYITAVFNGLHALDTRTRQIRTIPTVRCPMHLAIVPGKDLAYVSYQCGGPGGRNGHDAIDIRIASSGAATSTISGPPQVGGEIRASPDGGQVWVDGTDACASDDYDHLGCPAVPGGVINVYRVDDNYLLGSFGLSGTDARPGGISFFGDSSRAIVGGARLKVIDARSLRVVEEASLAAFGRAAFDPDGRRAYVVLTGEERLALFDLAGDQCVPPPLHLGAWWSGDGHANDVREDKPGELRNGAAIAPGWVGQGFRLDGRGAHVHITNVSSVDNASDFSAAVWIKPASTGRAETILDHGQAKTPGWKLMRNADSTLSVCDYDADNGDCATGRTVHSAATAPFGEWTHVAVVAAGHRVSLYLQGESSISADAPARTHTNRLDFRIGGSFGDSRFFAGVLDEVQLFRQALTPSEVRRLFAAGRYGLCFR